MSIPRNPAARGFPLSGLRLVADVPPSGGSGAPSPRLPPLLLRVPSSQGSGTSRCLPQLLLCGSHFPIQVPSSRECPVRGPRFIREVELAVSPLPSRSIKWHHPPTKLEPSSTLSCPPSDCHSAATLVTRLLAEFSLTAMIMQTLQYLPLTHPPSDLPSLCGMPFHGAHCFASFRPLQKCLPKPPHLPDTPPTSSPLSCYLAYASIYANISSASRV